MDKCFEQIKVLACKLPILKPVNLKSPLPIWVVTDRSNSGVGAYYSQGESWETCQPAGFLLKKFPTAQQNYYMHEHETIAFLEVFAKWEDKLIGYKFTLVCDNKGLEYFKTQKTLTSCQIQWHDFMLQFDYVPLHIPGEKNVVSDCFS